MCCCSVNAKFILLQTCFLFQNHSSNYTVTVQMKINVKIKTRQKKSTSKWHKLDRGNSPQADNPYGELTREIMNCDHEWNMGIRKTREHIRDDN